MKTYTFSTALTSWQVTAVSYTAAVKKFATLTKHNPAAQLLFDLGGVRVTTQPVTH